MLPHCPALLPFCSVIVVTVVLLGKYMLWFHKKTTVVVLSNCWIALSHSLSRCLYVLSAISHPQQGPATRRDETTASYTCITTRSRRCDCDAVIAGRRRLLRICSTGSREDSLENTQFVGGRSAAAAAARRLMRLHRNVVGRASPVSNLKRFADNRHLARPPSD